MFSRLKKILFVLILPAFFTTIMSKDRIYIPDLEKEIGEVIIPILSDNLGDIGSLTMNINYNSDVLEFIEFAYNPFAGTNFLFSSIAGNLKLVWYDINPVNVAEKLFELKFLFNGDSTVIYFSGINEVTDQFAEPLELEFVNGSIKSQPTSVEEGIENEFRLLQNYPNPFNPSTIIEFSLPYNSEVNLSVFNALGSKITTLLDRNLQKGKHSVEWNASGYSSGIYFYRLAVNGNMDYTITKQMLLLR